MPYEVTWDDSAKAAHFSEVRNLVSDDQPIECRRETRSNSTVHKMPCMNDYGHMVLKRGIIPADNGFWAWRNSVQSGTITRRSVTIKLFDELGKPVMSWEVDGAMPVKVVGAGLNANNNEVAIEELEFAHEGITTDIFD